jgi:hypothetical protein
LQEVDWESVVAVAVMAPQASTNWLGGGGQVTVMNRDGSTAVVSMSAMDVGAASWTNHGLIFSDQHHDYLIEGDGSVSAFESLKPDYQDGLVSLDNGTRVGFFNGGYADDGSYDEVVTTIDHSGSTQHRSTEWSQVFAACGNSAYGIAQIIPEGSPQHTTLSMRILLSDGKPADRGIATHTSAFSETAFAAPAVPCLDDEIVFISSQDVATGSLNRVPATDSPYRDPDSGFECQLVNDGYGHLSCPTVERWNVRTGQRLIVPIQTTGVPGVDWSENSAYLARYDQNSLVEGFLYWLHPSGVLLQTDISNGHTATLATLPGTELNLGDFLTGNVDYLVDIQDSVMSVLRFSPNGKGTFPTEILSYAIPDGALVSRTEFPEFLRDNSANYIVRSIAVNPTLTL